VLAHLLKSIAAHVRDDRE